MRISSLEDEVDGFEKEASTQRRLRGHSLGHPVSGEVASDQIQLQRSDVVVGYGQNGPYLEPVYENVLYDDIELHYPEDVMGRCGRQHAGSIKPATTPMCGGHYKRRPRAVASGVLTLPWHGRAHGAAIADGLNRPASR